jgi:hypothetical protein
MERGNIELYKSVFKVKVPPLIAEYHIADKILKRGSAKPPTKLAAEKFFFWLFLSSNDRSCRETYKSKILLFSNASMKNAEFHNFRFFRNRLKNEFFNILTLFWDYFYLSSLFKVRESLKRYRKEFSIKLPISVVTKTNSSKRLPVYKGWGSIVLYPFWVDILAMILLSHGVPKKWMQILKAAEILHLLIYYSGRKKTCTIL